MTIYYDSSALLKIYVQEEYSDFIRNSILNNQFNNISILSYMEIHSVFSRLFNNSQITRGELAFLKDSFNQDFKIFQQVPIDIRTIKRASELTYQTNLRTLDSIHLDTIELLKFSTDEDFLFACFDKKLIDAAISFGINILQPL